MPASARWIGVAGFACAVAWLMWMFRSLGRNLTDTVVTRHDAHFVDHGPYHFVRNPMYTGDSDGGRESWPCVGNMAAAACGKRSCSRYWRCVRGRRKDTWSSVSAISTATT